MQNISISRDGQEFGPYTQAQLAGHLRSGEIVGTDLAWHEGMEDWVPVSTLPGIAELLRAPATPENKAPVHLGNAVDDYLIQKIASNRKAQRKTLIGCVIGGVLALILGWLGITWVFSNRTGELVHGSLGDSSPLSIGFGSKNNIEVTSYTRGLFSSKVRTSIVFPGNSLAPDLAIPLETTIHHGPLITGGGGVTPGTYRSITVLDRSGWDVETIGKVEDIYGDTHPFRLVTVQSLSGETEIEGTIAPVTFDSDTFGVTTVEDMKFSFAGAEFAGSGLGTEGAQQISGSFDGIGVEMAGEKFKFKIGPVSFNLDIEEMIDGLITSGTSSAVMQSATVSVENAQFDIGEGTYENSNVIGSDGRLTISSATNLGKLRFVSIGDTPIELNGALSLKQTLKGLEVEPLVELAGVFSKIQEFAAESESGTIDPVSGIPPEIQTEFTEALVALFVPGIAWEFDTALTRLDGGKGTATFEIDAGYFGDEPLAEIAEEQTFRPLFDALALNIEAFLTDGFFSEPPLSDTVDQAIEGEMVFRKGKKVGMELGLKNGKATWNGNEVPLPEMLESVLDLPLDADRSE